MSDWIKLYIGQLVVDLEQHKIAIAQREAEIARLSGELEKAKAPKKKATP